MKLTVFESKNIIASLTNVVNFEVYITDNEGQVLHSNSVNFTGVFNQAALNVVTNNKRKVIVEESNSDNAELEVNGWLLLPILSGGLAIGAVCLRGDLAKVLSAENFILEIVNLNIRQRNNIQLAPNSSNLIELSASPLLAQDIKNKIAIPVFESAQDSMHNPEDQVVVIIIELSQINHGADLEEDQLCTIRTMLDRSGFKSDNVDACDDREMKVLRKIRSSNQEFDLSTTLKNIQLLANKLSAISWLDFHISCGNYYDGIEKAQISYQSALKTLFIGKVLYPEKKIYLYSEMALDVLLFETRNEWPLKHMFNTYEKLMFRDKNDCLKNTLDSLFFANLNIGKAADNLNIHRNTLRYRLDIIKECTGLDVTKLNNMFVLYSAVRLNRLSKVS
ncbi:MAG: carbohydrate diacid regulator [Gammaproteobacteria bacterium]|jgi:carbohydrate diacid regulator